MHGMPLAYLSGMIPHHSQWKCIDMSKDICYFGIRSYEPEEHQLFKDKNVLVFESSECLKENIHFIKQELYSYFKRQSNKYWISFDIDSVDATSFESTGTAEEEGLTLDFVENFFSSFAHKTVGMDFTEVNFELAPSAHQRLNDENTFRHLLELILHSVNDP
jgi:arginase family enzyme